MRRKIDLGTVKELNKTQAQNKAEEQRQLLNEPKQKAIICDMSVAELVTHYAERELAENSGRAAKPRKAYLNIFKNYILPKWRTLPLHAVKAVAVEE